MILTEIKRIVRDVFFIIVLLLVIVQWYNNFYDITNNEIEGAKETNEQNTEIVENRSVLKEPILDQSYQNQNELSERMIVGATQQLIKEYISNEYTTYPFGVYKKVSLDENAQMSILDIIMEITGLTSDQINNLPDSYFPLYNGIFVNLNGYTEEDINENTDKSEHFQAQVDFERFQILMEKVCELVGDKSEYRPERIAINFGSGATYENEYAEYQNTVGKDKLTGGFARYYCDVLSTVIAILPAVCAAYLWMKDEKIGMKECLYSKKISSLNLVCSRTFAIILIFLLPIIIMSFESLIPLSAFGEEQNLNVDYFAYIKYIFWWLLPTILVSIMVGTFFTILTGTPIGIFIQLLWWFLPRGNQTIIGNTKFYELVIRHNSLQDYESYFNNITNININRIIIVLLSVLLMIVSVWILENKRTGRWQKKIWTKKV